MAFNTNPFDRTRNQYDDGLGVRGSSIYNARADHAHRQLAIDWTAVTLNAGWTNYGGGQPNADYCKDSLGFVHFRGLVIGAAGRASNNISIAIGTGLQPQNYSRFVAAPSIGGVVTLDQVDISVNNMFLIIAGLGAVVTYLPLDNFYY